MATQVPAGQKPKRMRVRFEGALQPQVFARILILYLIGKLGAGSGPATRWNMQAQRFAPLASKADSLVQHGHRMGARMGFVAPDEKTIDYVHGRMFAPTGADWDAAVRQWRDLSSDEGAYSSRTFSSMPVKSDRRSPGARVRSMWSTSMGGYPIRRSSATPRSAQRRAGSAYMGLKPGDLLTGLRFTRYSSAHAPTASMTCARRLR